MPLLADRSRPGKADRQTDVADVEPATDTAGIDAEEVGDLSRRISVVDPLDGETTAVFQVLGGACRSHARRLCRLSPGRALPSSEAMTELSSWDSAIWYDPN